MSSIESALPRLNEFIERQLPTLNAPGLVLGLTHREQILSVGTYGLANREAGQPKNFSRFEIQSEQKSDSIELGLFRVGEDPRSPEFLRFGMVLEGKAMQAILSGGVYSRTFTL